MDEKQMETALAEKFNSNEPEVPAQAETPVVEAPSVETPSTIKIGDEEYSLEDAQSLIGLGKIGKEAEEKYGTKIDRVWPEFTKKSQRLKELEEGQGLKPAVPQGDQNETLTKEEAIKAAREIGLVAVADIPQFINDYMAGQELVKQTSAIAKEAEGKGIKTDTEAILTYMQNEGVKDPSIAIELMYRPQLKAWEEKQINKVKPEGIITESASNAGAKQPEKVALNRDNLSEHLRAVMNSK